MTSNCDGFGDELQRISVMNNLPSHISEDLTTCMQRLSPRMHQTLPHGSPEYNMAACDTIRTVASKNLMPADDFTKAFLQQILESLNSKDTYAAEEWFNTLLDIILVLPTPVLQQEVLPIAVDISRICKPVPLRINICKIIGRLALAFSPLLVKEKIMPVVDSLCQDVSRDVRAAMAQELPNISATLGLETTSQLMPHILNLSLDEQITVRNAVLGAIAQMLPRFPNDVLKNIIIPYTKRVFPEIVKSEYQLLFALSKCYGQYACGLKSVMVASEKHEFVHRYIQLSQMNVSNREKIDYYKPFEMDEEELDTQLVECRLNCAYNYPAMVLFASDLTQDVADSLIGILQNLASDTFSHVRRKIATGFYEVMKLMPRWHPQLRTPFIRLLYNEMDVVLEGLVPNISNILLKFSESGLLTCDRPGMGENVGHALISCEKTLADSSQWRLLESMLEALRVVPKVFHPDFVSGNFVPLLVLQAINGRIIPCRVAAVHTLLVISVDPAMKEHKLKICNKIIELCSSTTFQTRMLFLRGMNILLTLSPDTLRNLFFMNVISMADDKVPNIRLALCRMLVKLKAIAVDPLNLSLVAAVDRAVSTLRWDKDRDVSDEFKVALPHLLELDESKDPYGSSEPASTVAAVPFKKATRIQTLTNTMKTNKQKDAFTHMTTNQLKEDVSYHRSHLGDARAAARINSSIPEAKTSWTLQASEHRGFNQKLIHTRPTEPERKRTLDRNASTHLSVNQLKEDVSNHRSHLGDTGTAPRMNSSIPKAKMFRTLQAAQHRGFSQKPTHTRLADLERRRTVDRLSPDEFLVDTGISLKCAVEVKDISPSREISEKRNLLTSLSWPRSSLSFNGEGVKRSLSTSPSPLRSSLGLNINIQNHTSSLPVKTTFLHRPLSAEEIEMELLQSESVNFTRRSSDRLKSAPLKNVKKENKRLSLDVTEIRSTQTRPVSRSSNINKRYSLDVNLKKDLGNKKSLTCINNNLISTKLGSNRTGIVRPQSCIIGTEKVNHSKRSISVENLPPKLTRLASRLPVRSTDPKPTTPK